MTFERKRMTSPECKSFDTCSAPLCPLDPESLQCGVWFSTEEICRNREYGKLNWIKMQRKIARKTKDDGYFTLEMLNRNCVVGKGMQGLDPDKTEEMQLKRWLKTHPEKRKWSDEERQAIAQRLKVATG